jgi:hypothetical protein
MPLGLSSSSSPQSLFNNFASRFAQCRISQLLVSDQATVQTLSHSLDHVGGLDRTYLDQIKNGTQWPRVFVAGADLYISLRQIAVVKHKDPWNIAVAPEVFWNGHMELRWVQVRQFVQAERRLMAENSIDHFLAVSRPERPEHKIRSVGGREKRQAVNAAVFANPVPGMYVIRVRILGESGCFGLLGREKPLLLFRDFEQPP